MSHLAIVTDTDCTLPLELTDRYGIIQVPINVHFGEETLRAVFDLDDFELFARVERGGPYPTTSAPSPGEFAAAYEQAFKAGADQVLCLAISSEVSATYESALNGRKMLPDRQITVIDTRTLALGQGFMVLAAAEAAQSGADLDAAIAAAETIREHTHIYAALSTLKYLALSGRVPSLTAGFANLLDLKPILTLKNGQLEMIERVRTRRKAWARVIELAAKIANTGRLTRLGILHIAAPNLAQEFRAQLCEHIPCTVDILTTGMTPGMSVHGGVGMVGVTLVCQG